MRSLCNESLTSMIETASRPFTLLMLSSSFAPKDFGNIFQISRTICNNNIFNIRHLNIFGNDMHKILHLVFMQVSGKCGL